jgi:hypothetical protein
MCELFIRSPPDIIVTKRCTTCEKNVIKSNFQRPEWIKETDDNSRVCWPCETLEKRICLKCNKSKMRGLYSGIEWKNPLSICNSCAILESYLKDNTNEGAKKHPETKRHVNTSQKK